MCLEMSVEISFKNYCQVLRIALRQIGNSKKVRAANLQTVVPLIFL